MNYNDYNCTNERVGSAGSAGVALRALPQLGLGACQNVRSAPVTSFRHQIVQSLSQQPEMYYSTYLQCFTT